MNEINPGHYTELLDRLYIAMDGIERHILAHPLVAAMDDHEITDRITHACDLLAEVYQRVGDAE